MFYGPMNPNQTEIKNKDNSKFLIKIQIVGRGMKPRPRPKGREHIPSPPIEDVASPIALSPQQVTRYFQNKQLFN